jgi:hypothetical protein
MPNEFSIKTEYEVINVYSFVTEFSEYIILKVLEFCKNKKHLKANGYYTHCFLWIY